MLTRLVERQRSAEPGVRPVLPSLFEPSAFEDGTAEAGLLEVEVEERVPAPKPAQNRRSPLSLPPRDSSRSPEPHPGQPEVVTPAPPDVDAGGVAPPAVHEPTTTPAPTKREEPIAVQPVDRRPIEHPTLPAPLVHLQHGEAGVPAVAAGQRSEADTPTPYVEHVQLPESMVTSQPDQRKAPGEPVVAAAQPQPVPTSLESAHRFEEQPITVSVRIGRIEVRALAPAASAHDAAAAERRTLHQPRLSLEDYLARPNRGRS